ncbi:sugar transferase [Amycolatopsis anabasis]|uniref:sugar transferase n=1 Tax=Amycolatopsis anabasis TaxID=1840409 RepID=UPI00131E87EC|nr:sugar transferase [Amycolatopsis anabasis]
MNVGEPRTTELPAVVERPLVAVRGLGERPEPPRSRYQRWLVPLVLVLADAVAFAAVLPGVAGSAAIGLLFGGVVMVNWAAAGGYGRRFALSALDELPRLAAAVAITGAVSLGGYQLLELDYSGRRILVVAAAALVVATASRTLSYAVLRSMRGAPRARGRALICGTGAVGVELATRMTEHPEYGLTPVGFVDRGPHPGPLPVPLLGSAVVLPRLVVEHDIDTVFVAFGGTADEELVDLLRNCARLRAEIYCVPRLFELHDLSSGRTDNVRGIPVTVLPRRPFRTVRWRVKRIVDVVCAAGALLVLAPVLALVALAVRLDGGPGVLFRQERIGLGGRRFHLLKFRSMRPETEAEAKTLWSIADDDRVSRIGRLLRKTSLDELPQLFNVLRGEMSLVGPRPERPYFVERFSEQYPRYGARHRVPAGLTGLAAVHGLRGDTSIEDRVRYDNIYIESWSLWLEVKTVLRTLPALARRTGR